MMRYFKKSSSRGFTLVELAIVLAIIGVLTVGLWRLISGSNQTLTNQSAANQQIQLINSTKAFLASTGGQSFLTSNPSCSGSDQGSGNKLCAQGAAFTLPLPDTAADAAGTNNCFGSYNSSNAQTFCNFLPAGFYSGTTNPFGSTYKIQVLRDSTPNPPTAPQPPVTYSFMIVASGGSTIPDGSGGGIASLIGSDGGFVYSNNVCNSQVSAGNSATNQTACGAYSNWAALTTTFGFNGSYSGSIVTRTFISPQQDSNYPWLARNKIDPASSFNTMNTTLYVPTFLNMAAVGATSGGGTLNMEGGVFDLNGGTLHGTGTLDNLALTFNGTATHGMTIGYSDVTDYGHLNPLLTLNANCTNAQGSQNGANYQSGCNNEALSISGDEYITGQIFGPAAFEMTFSDMRMKRDIHTLNDPLGNIMRLDPVSFVYKRNGQKSLGVIAQDVEKVYPELVGEREGFKAVNYNGLIAPLLGAVQELKKENDQLKHRLDDMQQQINAQKKSD